MSRRRHAEIPAAVISKRRRGGVHALKELPRRAARGVRQGVEKITGKQTTKTWRRKMDERWMLEHFLR